MEADALCPAWAGTTSKSSRTAFPKRSLFFAPASDVPLTLGLWVDFSTSQEHFIKPHHHDLESFLKSALTARDRAFLVGFAKQSRLRSDYSTSAAERRSSLEAYEKAKDRFRYPLFGPPELRTDCGNTSFSDGDDISSAHTETEVIEAAQANDVVLFAISYTEPQEGRLTARNKNGISVMRRIAAESGGAGFDAREKGLPEHFKEIAEQVHYSLRTRVSHPEPGERRLVSQDHSEDKEPRVQGAHEDRLLRPIGYPALESIPNLRIFA